MSSQFRLRASRFALAVSVAVAFVLSAPFIGYVRSWIRTTFPGQFAHIIGGLVVVLAAAAIGSALVRIRERRAVRYAAIAAALAFAVIYCLLFATGNPEVDVVERFHFVEYGLITFLFYRAWKPVGDASIFVLPVLAALLVGTGDEWLQWFIPARIGELPDIFLNCAAIACGLLFSAGADPPPVLTASLLPGSFRRVGRLAAVVVLALGAFVQVVHLGYDVRDEEVGVFKSRYSASQLSAMAQEKAAEWRVRPLPLTLSRVSREDQYMSEGVTHVMERNRMWAAHDIAAAWKENRILEKYFAPVLDTPSYVSRTGHRWPDGQRADAQTRAAEQGAGTTYVSAANPSPIYTCSRVAFWAAIITVVTAILLSTAIADRP